MANLGDQDVNYPTLFDPKTCGRRGMCPVTQIGYQGEPSESHSLYFEVHGNGPQKIIFIMGLNNSLFGWLNQVDYFGQLKEYSTLVFDNRGVGMSEAPWGPYSTSVMAEDAICLLNHLGWTDGRNLHVVGVSLGGSIAQELAYRIPERILSLSIVGASPSSNFPCVTGAIHIARLMITKSLEHKISILMGILFPEEWLDALAESDSEGRTNREVQKEMFLRRFKITKPQTLAGVLGQTAACITHRMSPERLAKISASIPKVLILCANQDAIIPYTESENLKCYMPEAEYQCWEKTGHGIFAQHKTRFNQLLKKVFEESSRSNIQKGPSS